MGSNWCLRKFFRFLKLILMARHMFLCQSSQCQLGHMSLRRYQPPEPRGREPDTEVRGKGTCSTFVRGESQTLLYWATKICQLGEEFFFLIAFRAKSILSILSLAVEFGISRVE